MINDYYKLLKYKPIFFIFSISGVFFSAPGQTFLISLFKSEICQSFMISNTMFALLYSLATILASFLLYYIGKLIDTLPIKKMLIINTLFFSSSLILLSISKMVSLLFIALFFMRLFGQGALPITSSTHTIKNFFRNRGSALSLTQLGYPLSEFIFPTLSIFLLSTFGLNLTFIIFSFIIIFLYYPICLFSINYFQKESIPTERKIIESKNLKFVLRDKLFFIYLSLSAIPPSIMTAAFFFQQDLFKINNWNFSFVAIAIFMYALFKLISTLFVGPIIDRYGIIRPLFFLTFSLGLASLISSFHGNTYIAYIYYSLYGIGIGCAGPTMSYLWAKLYGDKHIGEIKGFIAIIRNGSTAVTPFIFALMNSSLQLSFTSIFFFSGLLIISLSFLPFLLSKIDLRLLKNT